MSMTFLIILIVLAFLVGVIVGIVFPTIKIKGLTIVNVHPDQFRESAWKFYKDSWDDAMLTREAHLGFDSDVRKMQFEVSFSNFIKSFEDNKN